MATRKAESAAPGAPWDRWLLLGSLTLLALLIRLPYWQVIPAANDEVNQTIFALDIAQGRALPLVGNDAYAGPAFFYLLAALLRMGIREPVLGRAVVLVSGTLTVPITTAWVAHLTREAAPYGFGGRPRVGRHPWLTGGLAGLLVVFNPDLILLNSHLGGTTYTLPFLATLFLLLITLAVRKDHVGWLIAAGVAAGLTLQANPVGIFPVAGGLGWAAWHVRQKQTLGARWPFWPLVAGLVVACVYAPVIVYNLRSAFGTVDVLQERSYLWQEDPTLQTTWINLQRLSMQMVRQGSGTLHGSEQWRTLIGIPLVYLALMLASFVYALRRVSALLAALVLPFWLIAPVVSNHYGFLHIGRFTTWLLPIWAAMTAMLLAAAAIGLSRYGRARWCDARVLGTAMALLLALPLARGLADHYQRVENQHTSGRALLTLSRYAAAENRGEHIYISLLQELPHLRGMPYVPHAAFLLGDVHHEFLPASQIVGRLFEHRSPAFLLLSDGDAAIVSTEAPIERVAVAANREAQARGFALYRLPTDAELKRPEHVIRHADLPDGLTPSAIIGEGVRLLGCRAASGQPGARASLTCYWQATAPLPKATYIGFAHLFDAQGTTLIAQDDHVLGQESYPLNAWQSEDIVMEEYVFELPGGMAPGDYPIHVGIYTWPDLARLTVPGSTNNAIQIRSLTVEPSQ